MNKIPSNETADSLPSTEAVVSEQQPAATETESTPAWAVNSTPTTKPSSEQAEAANSTNITTIRQQFNAMTPTQHAGMKRKLLNLATSGAARPHANTLEGFALAQYTTPNLSRCSSKRGMELN
jgi:hypothetical protein